MDENLSATQSSAPRHSPESDHMSDRYSRQILYPGIGAKGQQLLAGARVAIVGVGATGAASASLLARAGVGHLTLIDRDFVESSNLQRQILFDEADAAATLPKAEAARRKILLCNSSIQVEAAITDLNPANVHTLLSQSHILLDCTDNFETRYLLNDYAVREGKPWIYAAAIGAYAATMNILPGQGEPAGSQTSLPAPCCSPTACLACVFPTPPSGQVETCDTVGILSMAVNLAASIQSAEALKFLTHQPHLMRRTLLSQDLWTNQHREISTAKPNPDCPVCAGRVFSHLAGVFRPHITLCGRNSVQIHEHQRPIHLAETHASLARQSEITGLRSNAMLLRFTRGAQTFTVFPDGRALIQGTTDIALARSLYARFIGS
jgi:molybdopterin/thiamine biosynthesis adenylyltransferase